MANAIINMRKEIRRGETIEVKALIAHPMETGLRPGADGRVLPTNLIRTFSCEFDDAISVSKVFSANLFQAISANPYIAFTIKPPKSGTLRFTWLGDDGFSKIEVINITVS
jgi:sulfur-oxidizing protein SoxZ